MESLLSAVKGRVRCGLADFEPLFNSLFFFSLALRVHMSSLHANFDKILSDEKTLFAKYLHIAETKTKVSKANILLGV